MRNKDYFFSFKLVGYDYNIHAAFPLVNVLPRQLMRTYFSVSHLFHRLGVVPCDLYIRGLAISLLGDDFARVELGLSGQICHFFVRIRTVTHALRQQDEPIIRHGRVNSSM